MEKVELKGDGSFSVSFRRVSSGEGGDSSQEVLFREAAEYGRQVSVGKKKTVWLNFGPFLFSFFWGGIVM